jgi:homocysteine S-methyltransferase
MKGELSADSIAAMRKEMRIMAQYRQSLPQLAGGIFLTDGGLETTLVFVDGMDLPCFASFPLIANAVGQQRLREYFSPYVSSAKACGAGFILCSPTWRANTDWGAKLGYDRAALADVNQRSIEFLAALRQEYAADGTPIVIEALVGPRGDGYRADARMTVAEAERYHSEQMAIFRDTEADMVGAYTLNYPEEAIGIVRAARGAKLPVVISFTVETDGRLPSGDSLGSAIEQVDRATDGGSAYFMINCAHPSHFAGVVQGNEPWIKRLRGLRANASRKSHAELDSATEIDAGDPVELAQDYRRLRDRLPHLSVLGGCCGTDHRHVAAIGQACRTS